MKTLQAFSGTRFGTIEYGDGDTVIFPAGLIGLSEYTRFVLIEHKEGSPLRWLQSLEEPSFALLLVQPEAYVPAYAPEVGPEVVAEIEIGPDTPRMVFATVTIPCGSPEDMTLNLAGPLLINAANRKGAQIVLSDETYTTKHRVFPKANQVTAEAA